MILRIDNIPRPYSWGSRRAIADLLDRIPSGGPEAELWLGAHAGSPARIIDGASEENLAEWAAAHRPDGRLTFLMKVLAASEPLSLQVHPTLQQAREGYERENAAGIPLDSPRRNYKDTWHKPELLYALSDPFRALSGFRPVAEARVELEATADPRLESFIARLTGDDALPSIVEWLLQGDPEVRAVVIALSDLAADAPLRSLAFDTVRRLATHHPGDPGIAMSILMNTVVLNAGEAIYLPAGNIHAYLEGLGIEVMASSDNVLRGGLTSKHVDVVEMLRVLDCRPLPAPYLEPEHPQPGVRVFRPHVDDFRLAVMEPQHARDPLGLPTRGVAIALVLNGTIDVTSGNDNARVERGGAVLVSSNDLQLSGHGRVVVAWSEQGSEASRANRDPQV